MTPPPSSLSLSVKNQKKKKKIGDPEVAVSTYWAFCCSFFVNQDLLRLSD